MSSSVKKAVFPVAGLGTRFLPATKANPKEMLPIVDKPLIQYAAEEAIEAGIEELIFVTSSSKRAIEDHFDKNYELEAELERKNKHELLSIVRNIVPSNVSCIYVRQPEALGLGHAVLCAEPIVGNEPFAIILADDLIDAESQGCLSQMVAEFNKLQGGILGVEVVPKDDVDKYGIVDISQAEEQSSIIKSIVEKPAIDQAPSNLAVVGRYILPGKVFNLIRGLSKGAGGEIQLTDAIEKLCKQESVYAYAFEGKRFDCGSKLGYLDASINYALKHPELKYSFADIINKYAEQLS